MTTYRLVFKEEAKKEWDTLDSTVWSIFAKKLKERIQQPRIESSRLNGMKDCYKIKLNRAGYRLVYQVRDSGVRLGNCMEKYEKSLFFT